MRFCVNDQELVDSTCEYLVAGVQAGDALLVVATEPHRRAIEAALAGAGLDLARARADGRLRTFDAQGLLGRFMVGGRPDRARFEESVGAALRGIAELGRPVRAFGEMVALLWDAGSPGAAVELEDLWNELRTQTGFSLLCGYLCKGLPHAADLARVCSRHDAVVGDLPVPPRSEAAVEIATKSFDGTPLGARTARRFTVDVFERHGYGALAEDAAVVVAELGANAVAHARSRFTVTLSSLGASVRIEVRDDSDALPPVREPAGLEVSGRGLRMVASLATDWGARFQGAGKVVWADLAP